MIQTASQDVTKRLALVRQLYLHALQLSDGPPTLLRRITSVITYDLAAENALRVTIAALDTTFKIDTDAPHPKLVQHASDLIQNAAQLPLPTKAGLNYLHHIRNDAQHNGRYPSADEIAECRTHAKSFLSELCTLVWGLDFSEISLTMLVTNPEARNLLDLADQALRAGDHLKAVKTAAAGFSWLQSLAAQALFPRSKVRLWKGIGPVSWNIGQPTPQKPKIDQETAKEVARLDNSIIEETRSLRNELKTLREDVKEEFDAFEDPLLCSLLGISYSQYIRFRQIAGTQHFNAGATDFVVRGQKQDPTQEDASFVCAFCLEAALGVEGSVSTNQNL